MRQHYPMEVIQVCGRWYAAYPLRLRHLDEMMAERCVLVDHSTIHWWAIRMLQVFSAVGRRSRCPVRKR